MARKKATSKSPRRTQSKKNTSSRSRGGRRPSAKKSGLDELKLEPAKPRLARESRAIKESIAEESIAEVPNDLLLAKQELVERMGLGFQTEAPRSLESRSVAPSENIRGIGIGAKESNGAFTGDVSVKVFVGQKLSARSLSAREEIPLDIAGIPTDVEPVYDFHVSSFAKRFERPVPGGASCGHIEITAGTIGCLVEFESSPKNKLGILSNNHVLANGNDASKGDRIIQPGIDDGGTATDKDTVGLLERFVPLDYDGNANLVDAAVAHTAFNLVSPKHVTYVLNPEPLAAKPFLFVKKNGRTTRATAGWVSAVNVDGVPLGYRHGKAIFNDVIVVRGLNHSPFSLGGDSGSLVVSTESNRPVGLLFGGNSSHTLLNPIGSVMKALKIKRFIKEPETS